MILSLFIIGFVVSVLIVTTDSFADGAYHLEQKITAHFYNYCEKFLWLILLSFVAIINYQYFTIDVNYIIKFNLRYIIIQYIMIRFTFFDIMYNLYIGENLDYIGFTSKYDQTLLKILNKLKINAKKWMIIRLATYILFFTYLIFKSIIQ